ncbi:DNA replication/repair protein RecF [Pseudoxanthomonas composti]|uniref:DNA replication and repair protein RecF n=1 Tax=Pseudoxanthomonas composti TaxID=2137479 RepID=A0A4Q1JWM3_9GAMM|nr:DNA replication/repair protein RecF [Pseudoxanthomonas composti]RXR06058.1 DNA replication/repair protein RecF [Pseudoxanthomonas composti]
MLVTRLTGSQIRRFAGFQLELGPGLNVITGENGAGKTTVLEALHVMAYGRSFRGRVRDGLIRSHADALEIFVEWEEQRLGRQRRAGLRHSGQQWEGRLDGQNVAQLGDLCAAFAVVTFEPGSHALVTGSAEARRRYLDWGLFHVEPGFLPLWRRYARALKQRNALLKQHGGPRDLEPWEAELADSGEQLTLHRGGYLDALEAHLAEVATELVPSLGTPSVSFLPGWRRSEVSLADALLLSRERDRMTGYTHAGPHRADWRIDFPALPNREPLSRGQAKLTALSCLLAQAQDFAARQGEWPVVALDDLASELDRGHQERVLGRLAGSPAQVVITGTELPSPLSTADWRFTRFHVEHGSVGRPE